MPLNKGIKPHQKLNTHFLVFNSIKATGSIHCCIFYFVDNGIAGIEESLELFFLLSLQLPGAYQNLN